MNFRELKACLEEGFMRPDLSHNYDGWVNRALRRIQDDHSWSCMRDQVDVSVSAGSSVVSLPSDFKELTLDRYPIRVRAQGSTSSSPVVVTTRDTIKSYPLSSKLTYLPLSIRNDRTGNWSIFLDDPASEAMVFEVSYFRYLPKLEADGDYNDLTVSYEDMVETKVKATAFARINEFQDLAGPLEAAYLSTLLPEAIRIDERKSRSGRVYRMGG